jgi:hypothetical protein
MCSAENDSTEEGESRGGRVLRRTDSGRHWVEVSTSQALEKVSHALRGLPRRLELRSTRNVSSPSSSKASVSLTATRKMRGKRQGSSAPSSMEEQVIRTSLSEHELRQWQDAAESSAILETNSQLAQWGVSDAGNPFPTTGTHHNQEHFTLFSPQLQPFLALAQQQQQQLQQVMMVEGSRQEAHRKNLFIEVMARQLVLQEQQQLQSLHQLQARRNRRLEQQTLQLLLQQHQQQQQHVGQPDRQQLAQLLPHASPQRSLLASAILAATQCQHPLLPTLSLTTFAGLLHPQNDAQGQQDQVAEEVELDI